MIRKIICISFFAVLLQTSIVNAGTTGSEELNASGSQNTTSECFEGFSRAMFSLNHGLDKAIFKPVAKGYRTLPAPIRRGTGNAMDNLRSLLTLSNNILQGDLRNAGNTAGRFAINTTVGILGIFDPAAALGFEKKEKEMVVTPLVVRVRSGLGSLLHHPCYFPKGLWLFPVQSHLRSVRMQQSLFCILQYPRTRYRCVHSSLPYQDDNAP